MTKTPRDGSPTTRIAAASANLLGLLLVLGAVTATGASAQAANAERLTEAASLGWAVGEPDAPITVVEFTDVSCPYCASFHAGTRAELMAEFVESGQVRWITLVYISGLYPNSDRLSVAAECAGRQGSFDDFLRLAYEEREA